MPVILLFLFFLFPSFSFASTGNYIVEEDCTITIDYGFSLLDSMPVATAYTNTYENTYPATTTVIGGATGYQSNYWLFLNNGFPYAISSSTSSVVYNGLTWGEYSTRGAGDRWAYTTNIPNGEPQTIYKWTILSGGTCTPFNSSTPSLLKPFETLISSATIATTSLIVNYNIALSEWTNTIKPDYINVQINSTASSTYLYQKSEFILPLVDGLSSKTFTSSTSYFPFDGVYSVYFTMSSISSGVLSGIGLSLNVTVSGGAITSTVAQPTLSPPLFALRPCSLTELGGCIVNALGTLFVPSQSSINSMTSLVSSSSVPFLQLAYEYYDTLSLALTSASSTGSSTALSYSLAIPEAGGLDVEMFSVALMTTNLGSFAPIMRAISLALLFLGFWLMIIRTIQNKMGVNVSVTGGSYDGKLKHDNFR